MARAYSLDIREKVLEAYNRSNTKDKFKIAKRFKVSYDFVNDLVNLYNETGEIKPRPRPVNNPPKISGESLRFVELTVKANNDYTLEELADLLEAEKGIKVSVSGMYRTLKKLGLTLKKSHSNQRQEKSRK